MSGTGWSRVLDHYHNPRNNGVMDDPDAVAEDVNELCGDRIRFQLKFRDNVVKSVMFVGDGCAISTATASILTEKVLGATASEVEGLSVEDLLSDLGADIKPGRMQCVSLPVGILRDAVNRAAPKGKPE